MRCVRIISIAFTAGLLCSWCSANSAHNRSLNSIGMGTSVVIHMTPSSLLIAADGRVHTAADQVVEDTCKIRLTKDVAFTNAGLIRDQFSGFDLADVARRSLSSHSSINEAIQDFESQVSAFLRRFLPEIKDRFPAVYHTFDRSPGISVVFARMVAGKPTVHVRSFSAVDDPHGALSIQVAKQDCITGCENFSGALGHFEQIQQYLRAHPAAFGTTINEAADTGLQLLKLEAAANPKEVGPPFAILMLDSAGPRWIAPGGCISRPYVESSKLPPHLRSRTGN